MTDMTRERVIEILDEARKQSCRANLSMLDLSGLDLSWINFAWSNMSGSTCIDTNFAWANFIGANLTNTNFSESNFVNTNLVETDLTGTDLFSVNLYGSNLPGLLQVRGLPSGDAMLVPTPCGWQLRIETWPHQTVNQLWKFIAQGDWPGIDTDATREKQRPGLLALANMCEAHIAMWPDLIQHLAKQWRVSA